MVKNEENVKKDRGGEREREKEMRQTDWTQRCEENKTVEAGTQYRYGRGKVSLICHVAFIKGVELLCHSSSSSSSNIPSYPHTPTLLPASRVLVSYALNIQTTIEVCSIQERCCLVNCFSSIRARLLRRCSQPAYWCCSNVVLMTQIPRPRQISHNWRSVSVHRFVLPVYSGRGFIYRSIFYFGFL